MDLKAYFTADHKRCDECWSALEQAADSGNDGEVKALWAAFEGAMTRHLSMEEQVIFPAFEAATGMMQGPTHVMRIEHERMRGVLAQIGAAVASGDHQDVIDQGDTLLMLIQQHNVKEENMLYPMASQHLQGRWPELLEQLNQKFPA